MKTIATNSDNDVYLDKSGNMAFVGDKEALAQIVLHEVRTAREELMYNQNVGVPYFTTIFASPANIQLWESYLRDVVLSVEGVTAINSFEYKIEDGVLTYTMRIQTSSGEVSVNG